MKKLVLSIVAAVTLAIGVQLPTDAEARSWRHHHHRSHVSRHYHRAPRVRYYRPYRPYYYYAPAPVYYGPTVVYPPRPGFGVTFYAR